MSKLNKWQIGEVVKVGFVQLLVIGQAEHTDRFLPHSWLLSSLDGRKKYEFIPHNGLRLIAQN